MAETHRFRRSAVVWLFLSAVAVAVAFAVVALYLLVHRPVYLLFNACENENRFAGVVRMYVTSSVGPIYRKRISPAYMISPFFQVHDGEADRDCAEDVVSHFVSAGYDLDQATDGVTPLSAALVSADLLLVDWLVGKGASCTETIDYPSSRRHGMSALDIADDLVDKSFEPGKFKQVKEVLRRACQEAI